MKADIAPPGAHPIPRRSRPVHRAVLWGVAIAIAVAAAFTIADVVRVAHDVRAGRSAFAQLVHGGLTDHGGLTRQADRGARLFARADRIAGRSVALRAWSRVPFLGRPARWLRAAATSTADVSRRAADAVRRIEPKLGSADDGAGRLDLLDLVQVEFKRLGRAVEQIRLPSSGGFLPPVESARRGLDGELKRLRSALDDGVVAARGLRSFLSGPSSYLALAANNAEMRAGGMILQVGPLRTFRGRLQAGTFRTAGALLLNSPVPLPPEIEALYGWLHPDLEWRNVGSSPNFPQIAPVYATMAQRTGMRRVDGVFQIDVHGLRAILAVIGPVEVGGRRYDASNVERLVFHDLYVAYGGAQIERRTEFSQLAAATLRGLDDREWDLGAMTRALTAAAAGRHLLAWSSRPVEQAAWSRLGIDGALDRNGFMVTVQNHTGNKLDWFIRPRVQISVEHPRNEWRRINVRIRIVNPTPAGEPPYVAGDGRLVRPGDHRALVAVYLPGWATNVELPGRTVNLVGPDGPMRVIGTRIDVPRGGEATLDVVFSVPPRAHRLVLLPSARARPVIVVAERRRLDDSRPHVIPI